MNFDKDQACCFTGHRKLPIKKIDRIIKRPCRVVAVMVRDATVRANRETDRKYPDTKQGGSLPQNKGDKLVNLFETVKEALQITGVLIFYGVELKRGDKALCPLHNEKPQFHSPEL